MVQAKCVRSAEQFRRPTIFDNYSTSSYSILPTVVVGFQNFAWAANSQKYKDINNRKTSGSPLPPALSHFWPIRGVFSKVGYTILHGLPTHYDIFGRTGGVFLKLIVEFRHFAWAPNSK